EDGEGEREAAGLRVGRGGEALAQSLHIILQERVLHDLVLVEDLLGVGLPELDVVLFAEEVPAGLQRVAGTPRGPGSDREDGGDNGELGTSVGHGETSATDSLTPVVALVDDAPMTDTVDEDLFALR